MSWFADWFANRPRYPKTPKQTTRPQVEILEDRTVPTVNYYGGNVLTAVEAQALFLGSHWSAAANTSTTTTLNNFMTDVTGGAYMDALANAGYGVGRGSATAGVVDSRSFTLNSTISDSTIRSDIQADIKSKLLQQPDKNRLYIVYVEPNVAVNLGNGQGTTKQGILGYHGAFGGRDASGHATVIRYAVIAYPGGTVGNSSLGTSTIDQLTAVSSHELAEAVTDPDVNYSRLGWYDPLYGEIGDITENDPNALVYLDGYLVQEAAGKYDQLLTLNTTPTLPAPPPPTTATTTTTMTAGPVYYDWTYATTTLTITVKPISGTTPPSGTVALVYNGSVLATGTVQLVNGVATVTFNVQFYANGIYTFNAVYLGSGQFDGSTSNPVTVTV